MPARSRLFILDANALLHRAWHALPPFTNPEGKVVNAVYGVLSVMMKLLDEQKPEVLVACWDTPVATFRHEAYKEYKAQRAEQPDELYDQIPWLKEGLSLLGIDSIEKDGYEADDVIATVALQAEKDGWDVVIVTGDRDTLQLIRPNISVMAFKKGVSDTLLYDEAEVKKQYGLLPEQFVDYKALRGDPSDNIPGVKGIGEKGATDLLQMYQSITGILKAAHDPKSKLSPSTRQKLLSAEDELPAILDLVRLVPNVPIQWKPKKGSIEQANRPPFIEFLRRMGFKSLIKRVTNDAQEATPLAPLIRGEQETKKSQKKLDGFKETRLDNAQTARAALEGLRSAEEIVVRGSRGALGSLFANAIDGFVLGAKSGCYFFSTHLLNKEASLKKELSNVLMDVTISKIAHDIKGEMKILKALGLEAAGWTFDTMIAAYLLGAGERNHDLPAIALRYADMQVNEGDATAHQVEAIARLSPILRDQLKKEGLESVFERFELPLIPVLYKMEEHGILIDREYLKNLSKEMTAEHTALEKKMIKLVGREFNPASPSQLAEILFEDLKLSSKGIKRGKTGYSTAAPELEKLRGSHPIIEMIEEHREFSKMLSTYVDVLPGLADQQGRVHTTYNQAVAATGRLSSTEPNLQNIPIRTEVGRKIRHAFIASKGFTLLSCDYSQIELRIVAALAKDEKMLEAFKRGEDIHTATAAAIWNIPKEEITKDQRRIAKAINFGLIFGQGPQGLSQSAGISFADAKKFIAAYFDAYHGIKVYMEETKALAHKLGYVETFFGRRRYMPGIESTMHQLRAQAERMAINMPVQGTDADMMKLAMIALDPALPTICPEAKLLLQVHDELVFEVPEKEVKRVAAAIKEIMEHVEKIGVPIVVDTKAGGNWDEMERVEV